MKIEISRLNDAVHLEAKNEDGNYVNIDGSPAIGGENLGMRPMQMVLSALGSCSAFDLINILKKQRQELKDIKISVEGTRAEDQTPAVFTAIKMHYTLTGSLDKDKVEKALDLAVNKYCSVGEMLKKTANITYTYEIVS